MADSLTHSSRDPNDSKDSNEIAPFIPESPSSPVTDSDDSTEPKDKRDVVWLILMLHGLGTLISWNVFITIAPMYYKELKLKEPTDPQPAYVVNFMNYVCIASQLPNLLVNIIGMFSNRGNLLVRIKLALIVVAVATFSTMLFTFVDTSGWRFGFFIVTILTVVILNSANGFYQNSIYGLVGSFPFKYINAVVLGNNFCGLFVTILFATTTILIKDLALNAAVYFLVAFLLLVLCFISFLYLQRNDYFIYQMAVARRAADDCGALGLSDYVGVFKEAFLPLANVFMVFFVTLLLFPSVLLDIKLHPAGRTYDLPIPENLYATVFIFLNFNFFAVVGSKIADYIQWPSPRYVHYPIFARLLFVAIFVSSNYSPGDWRSLPVYITNEYAVFIFISLMSITHGYYSSISLMYAPGGFDVSKQRVIGKMSAFSLVFGIALGIGCSFLTNFIAHL